MLDTVYISSYAGHSAESVDAAPPHRCWKLTVRRHGQQPGPHVHDVVVVVDPFVDADYHAVFERYLRTKGDDAAQRLGSEDDIARVERQIDGYAHALLSQLRLQDELVRPQATELQLYIVEHHHETDHHDTTPGIHRLAWELLESLRLPARPDLRLRVNRVTEFAPIVPPGLLQTLAQADPSPGTYRILLVVARDFSRTGAARDSDPDLAQWPLMTIQRKLRGRMLLEVVRPGCLEGLREHLRTRSRQGVQFNLVHFDLHGQVLPDQYGVAVPWLLFTSRTSTTQSNNGYHLPQTRLAAAGEVADLLVEHGVEAVVLNACLSAYNVSSRATSLAHLLLRRGIRHVSAMWYYVHHGTVRTYLAAFYHELLREGVDFDVAAQRGRAAVRASPTLRAGRPYRDDFVCVNYARQSPVAGKSFLECKLLTFRLVYASDLGRRDRSDLADTMDRMASAWLATNMIEHVYYCEAKDFARRPLGADGPPPHRRRTSRASTGGGGGSRVPALRSALYIIRGVDDVVDPGWRAGAAANEKLKERRVRACEGLEGFARRLHLGGDGYCIFLGSNDARWFAQFLGQLQGAWWLHVDWGLAAPYHRGPITGV
ncbi:hypothetical protein CCM_07842 [Cordyceps militaris CM01]|uniref:CHAT domain-containing protein n=1 Tax=Cordyceps militaris (strain CM01) TaxID=983644 RepID=G3JNY0_CORMM|nr:uncharacterized protein CCM_07842 [Cordyceps militaris CM01]EGX89590.1 hypothetical protein CCM_07842 [Cordyceps militaris CM01]